jgi:hypothetical protein
MMARFGAVLVVLLVGLMPRHEWPAFTPPRWPKIRPPLTAESGFAQELHSRSYQARPLVQSDRVSSA